MSNDSKRSVEAEVAIEASIEDVWDALTTADGLARWFPPEAEVEPGEGGRIVLDWEGFHRWEMNIEAWEPPQHLRAANVMLEGAAAEPPAIDFRLEDDGEQVWLTVVHGGFPPGNGELLEAVERGWRYELRSLKQYLEHHPGETRRMIHLFRPVKSDPEDIWMRTFNREGFMLNMLFEPHEGLPCGMRTLGGDEFHGRVVSWDQPWQFAMTVETMNDGLLRIELDPYRDGRALTFTFSLWGYDDPERIERIRKRTAALLAMIAQRCEADA